MSKEKQIEEMAEYIFGNAITHDTRFKEDCRSIARDLYTDGYRKHGEGHWEKDEVGKTLCSQCGVRPLYRKSGTTFATTFYPTRSNYCPNCGAKMKGGAE